MCHSVVDYTLAFFASTSLKVQDTGLSKQGLNEVQMIMPMEEYNAEEY